MMLSFLKYDKKLRPRVTFLVEVFLYTNVWIFLYTKLLVFFRALPLQKGSETFLIQEVSPEPFEIPLYIFLTLGLACCIFLFHRFVAHRLNTPIFWLISLCLVLFILFAFQLGAYPLHGDSLPYLPREDKTFYFIRIFIYLVGVTLVVSQLSLFGSSVRTSLQRNILYFFAILLTAFFIFEPQFPISGQDYAHFYGPIWEVAHGKTIFTQMTSQYAFVLVLFLSFLLKLGLFQLHYLQYIVWFMFVGEYLLIFYLIYKISKSASLAGIALFSVITINYLSLPYIPIFTLQTGPLRWFPLIFAAFFFLKARKIDSQLFISFVALASLWIIDAGIYLLCAYFTTLFFFTLKKLVTFRSSIKAIVSLLCYLLLLILLIEAFHLIAGYPFVDISLMFTKIRQYAIGGFRMIPMDLKNYFWLLIFSYFISAVYFFKKKNIDYIDQLVFFISHLALFGGIYFVGRSHLLNWYSVSALIILSLFSNISLFMIQIKSTKLRIILSILLFFVFIIFPAFSRKEAIAEQMENRLARLAKGDIFKTELNSYLDSKYGVERNLIKKSFKEDKILILHPDETYLFYMTNKNSLLLTNPQISINTQNEAAFALQNVLKDCPQKIAVDCRVLGKCSENWYFTGIYTLIQPYLLQRIEDACKAKYYPTFCTQQLCIAEKKQK